MIHCFILLIISGSNTNFPIVAHSGSGKLSFKDINPNNPLQALINSYKFKVKRELYKKSFTNYKYLDDWKDLGKEGYTYEVELTSTEPKATRGRRRYSSGKPSIYPYTGKALDTWHQAGGYNYYADNNSLIGCPAIAIGMLMYDTSQRPTGSMNPTKPNFAYSDMYDITNINGTDLARRLRQIADSIPNYKFTQVQSGASPNDVKIGLQRLGYTECQFVRYDFDLLYNNMCYTRKGYFGDDVKLNRGTLIFGFAPNGEGHIWFCDGYYEQSYTVRKKFFGKTIKKWTEYDDRIYLNWGFGENNGGNGWYCATEDFWRSLSGQFMPYYMNVFMFINLSHYEYR